MRLAGLLFCLVSALSLGVPSSASAADETEVDRARKLAQDAADSLDAGQFAEALERAKQAEELFHAPTHILLMGQALEGLGRLAEAAETYEKLVAEPLPAKGSAVFRKAQDEGANRLKAFVAKIPSLLLRVRGPKPNAATATVDGQPFTGFESARRFDPGDHKVHVEAEGFIADDRVVSLPAKGGVVSIEIVLKPVVETAPTKPVLPTPPDTTSKGSSPFLAPTLVAFGVGVAGLGVGAVTGGLFLSQLSDLKDRCPADRCPPEEQPNIDDTGTMGNVSTVALSVGGAAAATAVVLLIVSLTSSDASEGKRPAVLPMVGPGWLGVGGRF